MPPTGLEAVLLENRDQLIRFLAARGAGDSAEDLVHDLWLKVSSMTTGPIGNPVGYLFRAADRLMIDRHRARRQAVLRDDAWGGDLASDPSAESEAEREVVARQEAARVAETLAALGPRRETVFRRTRLDGEPYRQVAAELGISVSTVESDLRMVCRTLAELKERIR